MGIAAQTGKYGERVAQDYLEDLGLKFLEANWWCRVGEIDLIMQDQETRVFVEVRLRRSNSYGVGFDTVDFRKQQKLVRAAQTYQQEQDYWGDVRFDVVSIAQAEGEEPEIQHIAHAFDLST